MTPPPATFVVVNWNQRDLTLACLSSLRAQRYPAFDVVLVDNGSADGSVEAVRAAFPEVHVAPQAANLGIAAANNVGIRHALAGGAAYVFLLNNDTVVDPDMLSQLVAHAESDPRIGVTGPTMLYHDRPDVIWCTGNRIVPHDAGTVLLRNGAPAATVAGLPPEPVDYIATCAACIKRAVFDDVGLMDERYFIYYDETDWFARAAAQGWRFHYVPPARMWHKVSASMPLASPGTTYYMTRNRYLFIRQSAHGPRRLRLLAVALAQDLRTLAAQTLHPRHRPRRAARTARALALRDAALGRYGQMGEDVAKVCYPAARNPMTS